MLSFSWPAAGSPGHAVPVLKTSLTGSVHVTVDGFGIAHAHGVAVFRSGADTAVFKATPDGTTASCADQNGNGVGGVTRVEIGLESERSGERISAVIVPDDGEIDEDGWHPVTIRIGRMTLSGFAHAIGPRADGPTTGGSRP